MTQSRQAKPFSIKPFADLLYVLAIAAAGYFAFLNISPYVKAVHYLGGSLPDISIISWLTALPLIGWIFAIFGRLFPWIVGVVLWGVLQILQVAPILIKHDKEFMRAVLREYSLHGRYAPSQDDDRTQRAIKRALNAIPGASFKNIVYGCLFSYVVDTLICYASYPPVDGGIGKLLYVLITGQWQLINWGNVFLLSVTVFVVEVCVRGLLMLNQIRYYLNAKGGSDAR
ncbi:hypothetical protein NIES2109_22620 [Nostoc sp. HK-01]|nr:hypothetical protein NIES2109_22620 [Nostoc sp. HK-01]